MRWISVVLGVVLIAVGGVFIFQGAGILRGSFMTGQFMWLWVGILCSVLGLPLFVRGLRRSRH